MRFAQAPRYSSSFPVKYSNMYNDYSLETAGFSDPFNSKRKEENNPCNFVVSYTGEKNPHYEMNNPAYMREVYRSHSDNIPSVILNKKPIQNQF